MNPTRRQLRELARENAQWPDHLVELPPEIWPDLRVSPRPGRVFRSRHFLVQEYFDQENNVIRLSINRTEWDPKVGRYRADISWDDLQRLKGEAGYGDRQAVEIFPEADHVVNVANMRHLWVLPTALPFAWRRRATGAPCPTCDGKGRILDDGCDPGYGTFSVPCPACSGATHERP